MEVINRKPDGFPPIKESPSQFVNFLVAYIAGMASILTYEKWPLICAKCWLAADVVGANVGAGWEAAKKIAEQIL